MTEQVDKFLLRTSHSTRRTVDRPRSRRPFAIRTASRTDIFPLASTTATIATVRCDRRISVAPPTFSFEDRRRRRPPTFAATATRTSLRWSRTSFGALLRNHRTGAFICWYHRRKIVQIVRHLSGHIQCFAPGRNHALSQ